MNDAAAKYTYCTFITPWQLVVWNNENAISASTNFYVDIYNIDQPKASNVGGNQKIMVTIDADSTYSNGVAATAEIADVSPDATVPTDFIILKSTVTSNYILSTQTLTILLDMKGTGVFTTPTSIYVLFPAAYAQWIQRSDTIPVATPATATDKHCVF